MQRFAVRMIRSDGERSFAVLATQDDSARTRDVFNNDALLARYLLLVANDEVDDPGWIGNPEPVEIFAELLYFVPARDAVDLEI